MHRNPLIALSLALALSSSSAVAETAQSHASAAKKAERHGDWQKALSEWKAAYGLEINAEYLIGIGDSYARLGNREEARKQYDAYVSDPLASPKEVEKVKAKLAALDARRGKKDREFAAAAPALPDLELPMLDAPPPQPATAGGLALPDLPPAAVADHGKGKKGKRNAATLLPMPDLDLPMLPLAPTATAAASPSLPAAPPPAVKPSPAKPAPKTLASTGTRPASTATSAAPVRKAVPEAIIAETPTRPIPQSERSSTGKVMAWVAAGVAVAALGGGFLAYNSANSADKEVTGGLHSGAAATQLLETEKRNKSLAFVGLSAGLLSAGIATALFAF